jgi:hypothetical protein
MKNRTILTGIAAVTFAMSPLMAQEQPPKNGTPPTGDVEVPEGDVPNISQPIAPVIPQMVTGAPNAWFKRTKLFMGEFLDQEKVRGKFSFKNPTAKKQTWNNLSGSCQCVRATIKVGGRTFELSKKPAPNSLHELRMEDGKVVRQRVTHMNIQPGDTGEIEVEMEMGGLQGLKDATLAIETTDEDMQQVTLAWQAKGVKLFDVTPNDVFLNNMTWADKRTFKFMVASDVKPDFKLLDHEALPDYVKVTRKDQVTRPNGKKAWLVEGTFGPNADPKAGGASIKFKTDWAGKEIALTVIATVTGPITIEPGTFLSFGKIRKGKGAERKITFIPNGDFDLSLVGVKFPKLTFDEKYITAVASKDGKNLVVTVKIAPGVKGSYLVRGAMELELNHPSIGTKMFNFNGILR